MDGGCPGLQLHPEGAALAHQLRGFQLHLLRRGHHHPVARGLDGRQGIGDFVVLLLDFGQLRQQLQQLGIGLDGNACLAAENLIEQAFRELQTAADCAGGQIHTAQGAAFQLIPALQLPKLSFRLPQIADTVCLFQKLLIERLLHRVSWLQRLHPPGQPHLQPGHGEGIQQCLQKLHHLPFVHALTVGNHRGLPKFRGKLLTQSFCPLPLGIPGVDHHQKGLPRGLHIPDGALLRLGIVLPGDIGDGAVGGHHQPDGAVTLHHLFRPQLRRLSHGHLGVRPGGGDHPGLAVLLRPHSPGHHVAHGVDHPHPKPGFAVGADFHRLLRDEFRL